jgi:tetratricopeptide (TPR) repeat protein
MPGSQLKLQSLITAKSDSSSSSSTTTEYKINTRALQLSIEYLSKSAQLDPSQNLTWYYLGRALACKGSSREAFISYKNSVNNPEASSDTWCSIGVLYHQQKQYMDALQAFICAIQLDHTHFAAWLNLGVLYEQDNQMDEALKCYKTAIRFKLTRGVKAKNNNTNHKKSKENKILYFKRAIIH